jgi:hypothetical protein
MLLRMDWDEWLAATEIYRELAIATHRTANRPMPVPPPPTIAQTLEAADATPTADPPEEGSDQTDLVINIKL